MYLVNRAVYRFFYGESLDEVMYFKGDIMKRLVVSMFIHAMHGSSLGRLW